MTLINKKIVHKNYVQLNSSGKGCNIGLFLNNLACNLYVFFFRCRLTVIS